MSIVRENGERCGRVKSSGDQVTEEVEVMEKIVLISVSRVIGIRM